MIDVESRVKNFNINFESFINEMREFNMEMREQNREMRQRLEKQKQAGILHTMNPRDDKVITESDKVFYTIGKSIDDKFDRLTEQIRMVALFIHILTTVAITVTIVISVVK